MDMKADIRELAAKGYTNPSAITSILYLRGHTGRFMEVRKAVITELQQFQMERSAKK